jgi:hypothetical protein
MTALKHLRISPRKIRSAVPYGEVVGAKTALDMDESSDMDEDEQQD